MMSLNYPIAIILFSLGIYCLLFRRNIIKMVIGLEILTDGVHLLLISLGYKWGGGPPIIYGEFLNNVGAFAAQAVDPIPQVLVLTSIVIDISITALALSLAIYAYEKYGTLNPAKIRRLRG